MSMSKLVKVDLCSMTPVELDYAIAMVERVNHRFFPVLINSKVYLDTDNDHIKYSPTDDWAVGGPLVAKYQTTFIGSEHFYLATIRCPITANIYEASGETHLIATMRAIMKSISGDQVELPYSVHECVVGIFAAIALEKLDSV